MRSVFLSTLFISFSALAQFDPGTGALGPCTAATFTNGGTYNCSTLTLSATPAFVLNSTPIIIKVTGTVTIDGTVDLRGQPGAPLTFTGLAQQGGDGGPGNAGDGGGDDGGGTHESGSDASNASGAGAGPGNATCGDGGGGAGFAFAGDPGTDCPGGTNNAGAGGTTVPAIEFSLDGILRGGFGGGAGAFASGDYGSGGGGGGFIKIMAAGNITITGTGNLLADGGDGGAAGPDGGGGGGGSGGVIWLQTSSNIIIDGVVSADGGLGGAAALGGGLGGAGGFGIIRLEDSDGVITGLGAGALPAYTDQIDLALAVGSPSLNSDISCGMIKPAEENDFSHSLQMIMGFLLVMTASFFINRLKFFSKTQI